MGLTFPPAPLAGKRAAQTVNYRIDGPAHLLFFDTFPRRVRAEFAGETVLDTSAGMLLHETGILPQLYVPEADVRIDLLVSTDHSTHCPFKGDAAYHSVRAGDRQAENAVWSYPDPTPAARWLPGYLAFYWDHLDAWFDEDEQVYGHLRDPYHRVDTRRTSRKVTVSVGGEVIADSARPIVLSETGLPNRWYVPADDVRGELLQPSETAAECPYKGTSDYASLQLGDDRVDDVAWRYREPLTGVRAIAGHWCFDDTKVDVAVG